MKRYLIMPLLVAAFLLQGCGTMLQRLAGPPPTAAVLNSTSIDEASIDLIRDLFDVALYGVEALNLTPRSPQAVRVARLIRTVTGLLGAADQAQKAGSASTYTELIRRARAAIRELQQALGMPADTSALLRTAPSVQNWSAWQTPESRLAIAARLDPSNRGGSLVLR